MKSICAGICLPPLADDQSQHGKECIEEETHEIQGQQQLVSDHSEDEAEQPADQEAYETEEVASTENDHTDHDRPEQELHEQNDNWAKSVIHGQ